MTLSLDVEQNLLFGINDIIGQSIAALGSKGSGKSNTCAVLAEESLTAGLPVCIVDIEGEYWGLKQRYQVLVAGCSTNVDLNCKPRDGAALADFSLREGVSLVLDVSEFSEDERMEFLSGFFERLWIVATEVRKPYQILLEESHQFITQKGKTPVKEIITKIALLGRKRGLGIILASQRSALVEKNVITQCGIFILHKVIHPTDKGVYYGIVPKTPKQTDAMNSQLAPGQAIVIYRERVDVAQIRKRYTYHGGYTPGLDATEKPELKPVDTDMLERLQKMLSMTRMVPEHDPEALRRENAALKDEIKILRAELDEKLAEIEELKKSQVVETMTVSQIVMPTPLPVITPIPQPATTPNGGSALMVIDAPAPVAVAEAVAEAAPTDNEAYRSTKAIARHAAQQRRQFEALKAQVSGMAKYHRSMLRFLANYSGEIKIQSLARELDYSLDTLLSNPPTALLERGLIFRQKKLSTWYYTGSVEVALKDMCPDLDTENLVNELLETAK